MDGLTPIGWQALVTVSGLLGVGLLIVFAMTLARRRREAAPAGDTVKRVPLWVRFGTLAALAVGVLVPAYLGEPYFAAVVLLVTLLGLGEFWDMLAAGGVTAHRWVGWAGAVGLLTAGYFYGLAGLGMAMAAFVMVLLPVALFRGDLPSLPARAGGTALGVLYVSLAAVFLILMRQAPNGFGHVVYYMMVITLVDVFGLVAGVAFGTRPMAPVLSPGKTLEGTLGSALAGVFGGWLFAFAVPELGLPLALAVALVLFAVGLVGDLLASGFKRAVGIKDFSQLLPGHGGILDRFDGYLFAAPVGWALLTWLSR